MADEFLRTGGRGDDGTAKAIKTDNDGNLYNVPKKSKNYYNLLSDIGTVAAGATASITIDLSFYKDRFELFNIVGRAENDDIKISIRPMYQVANQSWQSTSSSERVIFEKTGVYGFETPRIKIPSNQFVIRVANQGDNDLTFHGFTFHLWHETQDAYVNENGEAVKLSTEQDPDGHSLLRVVDAAPFAYDEENNAYRNLNNKTEKVFVKADYTGSNVKYIDAPHWAKGALVYLRVYSSTGDGSANIGYFETMAQGKGFNASSTIKLRDDIKGVLRSQHAWYPGSMGLGDAALLSSTEFSFKAVPLPATSLKFELRVSTGESLNAEMQVDWIG